MSSFQEAIAVARNASDALQHPVDTTALGQGAEVQLSVRVCAELRSAVAATAAAQGMTVTAFVEAALIERVKEANDSFSGLAGDLARHVRFELRSLVERAANHQGPGDVNREEAWS